MKLIKLDRSPEKILVVKPSSLGDVVHSLPFLSAMRVCFPKAVIHWVIAKGLEGLLEGHPMIDKLVVINKDSWKKISNMSRTMKEIKSLLNQLKNEHYDMVIDLQGLFRSGIITMSTMAPLRIGLAEAREGSRLFYNCRIRGGKEVHAVDRYMKIAEALGCGMEETLFPFGPVEDTERISRITKPLGRYAVIVPGARWETKIWPAERFGRLASMLPLKSIVIGSGDDVQIAEEVVEFSGGRAISLAGMTTLRELIEIMSKATLVISNDSGPMHIASGFHVPVVAIFGPTSPVRTGPYGGGHCIIRSEANCSPCFKKRCPDLRCMEGITVDYVYGLMKPLLESFPET